MENLKHIIESLLFVAEEPLTVDKIKRIIPQAETTAVREALAALADEYQTRGGGFYLDEVAGGHQIRTRPEYNEWIIKLVQPKPLRLSKAALETLVIIAYKQPIIRSDIEHLRGVDCGGVLRVLLERKLIRVLGRREIAGRPLIYATTKRFLEVFDLKDLKDLPTPKEIEELGASLSESAAADDLEATEDDEDEYEDSGGYETAMESSEEADPEPDGAQEHQTAEDQAEDFQAAADDSQEGFSPAESDQTAGPFSDAPDESQNNGDAPQPADAPSPLGASNEK